MQPQIITTELKPITVNEMCAEAPKLFAVNTKPLAPSMTLEQWEARAWSA